MWLVSPRCAFALLFEACNNVEPWPRVNANNENRNSSLSWPWKSLMGYSWPWLFVTMMLVRKRIENEAEEEEVLSACWKLAGGEERGFATEENCCFWRSQEEEFKSSFKDAEIETCNNAAWDELWNRKTLIFMLKFIGNMEAKSVDDTSVIIANMLLGPTWPYPSLALWFARGRLSSWFGEAEKRRAGNPAPMGANQRLHPQMCSHKNNI